MLSGGDQMKSGTPRMVLVGYARDLVVDRQTGHNLMAAAARHARLRWMHIEAGAPNLVEERSRY
jgi:hypothetical protein